eukprot:COSAG04_NODE_2490_length_4021_cov_1.686894_1_plen_151_part_10
MRKDHRSLAGLQRWGRLRPEVSIPHALRARPHQLSPPALRWRASMEASPAVATAVERLRAEQLASAPEALAFLLHCFMEELRGTATSREATPTVQTAEFAGEVTLQVVAVGESALAVHVLRPGGPPIHWAVEVGAFAGVRSEVGAEVEAAV